MTRPQIEALVDRLQSASVVEKLSPPAPLWRDDGRSKTNGISLLRSTYAPPDFREQSAYSCLAGLCAPTDNEIETAIRLLESHNDPRHSDDSLVSVNFTGYYQVRDSPELASSLRRYFTALQFLSFPRDEFGCVWVATIAAFLRRCRAYIQRQVTIEMFDGSRSGILSYKEFSNLVDRTFVASKLYENFSQNPWITHKIVEYTVTVGFLELDPLRRRRISVTELVGSLYWSSVLTFFDDVQLAYEAEQERLGFGQCDMIIRDFQHNIDDNGVLDLNNLCNKFCDFYHYEFTQQAFSLYVDRKHSSNAQGDASDGEYESRQFKFYVELWMALNRKEMSKKMEESVIRWIFSVMDTGVTGKVSRKSIRAYLLHTLKLLANAAVRPDSDIETEADYVLEEIWDVVLPRASKERDCDGFLTLRELLKSPMGLSAIRMFIDYRECAEHERKEENNSLKFNQVERHRVLHMEMDELLKEGERKAHIRTLHHS